MTSNKSIESLSSNKHCWIEDNIYKVECNRYFAQENGNCKCGRTIEKHLPVALENRFKSKNKCGNPTLTTRLYPTDAFGTLEFQGGPHPLKAKYVRIHHQTSATKLLHLLLLEWKLKVPNLVISIIGGLANFDLQPKLKKVFKSGLIKAAKTTGAWVLTSGLDTGVAKHVGEALKDEVHVKGSNIVALGISPWGIVQHRKHLVGKEKICPYYSISNKNQNQTVLNQYHNYFLLSDNGTVDKFGAEKCLRRNLERHLATQSLRLKNHGKTGKSRVPVVAVLVEGGIQAFRVVFELLTDENPVPVVVCEGSGRAADLLALMHRYSDEEGELTASLRDYIFKVIAKVFPLEEKEVELLYKEIKLCLKRRELISIFRIEDESPDIDVAILTALLQESGPKLNKQEQLTLTIAWNRPDIARSQIFDSETDWVPFALENAMTDVLINNRVEFLKLLLQNGVNMHSYLNSNVLESLYNARYTKGDMSFRSMLLKTLNCKKAYITLRHVGSLIEILSGSGYQHHYCDREHLAKNYEMIVECNDTISSGDGLRTTSDIADRVNDSAYHFRYPYTELLQWTLLTKRYDMALYMVVSGEESIAKSLFAVRLLKSIRKLLDVDIESEYLQELRMWEIEYEKLAVDLQDHCYKNDPEEAKRLLCYELNQFSGHTCISLAYLCQSKPFLSHVCTQNILNDLWYGGLREGKFVGLKVLGILLGLLMLLPSIPIAFLSLKTNRLIDFKTKEELARQPQTLEEYLNDTSDSSSDSSSSDSDSSDDGTDCQSKSKIDEALTKNDEKCLAIDLYPISSTTNEGDSHVSYDYVADLPSKISTSDPNLAWENDKESYNYLYSDNISQNITSSDTRQNDLEKNITFLNAPKENKRKSDSNKFHISPTVPAFTNVTNNLNRGRTNSNNSIANRFSDNYANRCYDRYNNDCVFDGFQDQGSPLSWKKKIYEFFYAPITKFYLNVLAYSMFIVLLIRLGIIKLAVHNIDVLEMYVYSYIITNFIDNYRKIKQVTGINLLQKIKLYFESFWNTFDFCLTLLSLNGIILRIIALYQFYYILPILNSTSSIKDNNELYLWGRNLQIICSGGWIIRSLELMQNWRVFGAYIEMIRCMSQRITPPIIILGIIMTSFGTIRQGIMYHGIDNLTLGNILKSIYLKPYFMLYGEVYAPEIDPVDFPLESQNTPLIWVVPVMMVIFMLSAVVIILSLIIAGITDIFGKVRESSVKVYMYLRYPMIIEYESRLWAPPPFIVLLWLYSLFKKLFRLIKYSVCLCCRKSKSLDNDGKEQHSAGLKLFLSQNDIEKLHDFEEECVEDYWRQVKVKKMTDSIYVYETNLKNIDHMNYQLQELHNKCNIIRQTFQGTSNKLHDLNYIVKQQNSVLTEAIRTLENRLDKMNTNEDNNMTQSLSPIQIMSNKNKSVQETVDNLVEPVEVAKSYFSDISKHNDAHKRLISRHDDHVKINFDAMNSIEKNDSNFQSTSFIIGEDSSFYCNKYNKNIDDIFMSGWRSSREAHPSSPTNSLLNLSTTNKIKKGRHVKNRNKRNRKQKTNIDDSKDETFLKAEKLERDEMASVMVQRLRQLSDRKDDSSTEEVVDNLAEVVNEITQSNP